MKLRNVILAGICLLSLAASLLAQSTKPTAPAAETKAADTSAKEKAAQPAAESWLVLVDTAKLKESWEQAAQVFQKAVSKEDWASAVQQAREPLGKFKARKLKFSQYKDSLPGAPAGEYVLLQYESSFEAMEKASEVISLTLEKDGKWRVVGYFVR